MYERLEKLREMLPYPLTLDGGTLRCLIPQGHCYIKDPSAFFWPRFTGTVGIYDKKLDRCFSTYMLWASDSQICETFRILIEHPMRWLVSARYSLGSADLVWYVNYLLANVTSTEEFYAIVAEVIRYSPEGTSLDVYAEAAQRLGISKEFREFWDRLSSACLAARVLT